MTHIGAKVKHIREAKGLNQTQLAEMISMDPSLISKIEKGHTVGSIATLQKIAGALNVPLASLIDDPKPMASGE